MNNEFFSSLLLLLFIVSIIIGTIVISAALISITQHFLLALYRLVRYSYMRLRGHSDGEAFDFALKHAR